MRILLSTSKTQDFTPVDLPVSTTVPQQEDAATSIASDVASWSADEIRSRMHVSERLANDVHTMFQQFKTASRKPALFAYTGTVFQQLQTSNYSNDALNYVETHLRIISGLYGLLRPLNTIKPYRYEMKLASKEVKQSIIDDLLIHDGPLINLASSESITKKDKQLLAGKLIDIDFIQIKAGKEKRIAMYAKKARGKMLNWMIEQQITNVEDIQQFSEDGYQFVSTPEKQPLTFHKII